MRKKVESSGEIKISRTGEPTVTLPYQKGETVEDVLERAEISLSASESLFVESEKAEMEDTLDSGDFIQIVGKKDGGLL